MPHKYLFSCLGMTHTQTEMFNQSVCHIVSYVNLSSLELKIYQKSDSAPQMTQTEASDEYVNINPSPDDDSEIRTCLMSLNVHVLTRMKGVTHQNHRLPIRNFVELLPY